MRKGIVAVAVAAFALAAAQPAAAVETFGVTHTTTDAEGNKLNQGANGRVLNSDGSGMDIQFECFANMSLPAIASAIGIRDCYIVGANGMKFHAGNIGGNPGTFTARWEVLLDAPRQRYRICVRSGALVQGASTFIEAPLVCSA